MKVYTSLRHTVYPVDVSIWGTNTTFANWFKFKVSRNHYDSSHRGSGKINDDLVAWLETVPVSPYCVFLEEGSYQEGRSSHMCVNCFVFFRSKRDATLFKVYWP